MPCQSGHCGDVELHECVEFFGMLLHEVARQPNGSIVYEDIQIAPLSIQSFVDPAAGVRSGNIKSQYKRLTGLRSA